MKKLPTERDVLRCIYALYESAYPGPKVGGRHANDPYISIDTHKVAERLNCPPQLLFGYLYYHLEAKHHYMNGNAHVHLFSLQVGDKRHAVNFPYLAAILAGHDESHRRQLLSVWLSGLALALSAGAIIAQLASN